MNAKLRLGLVTLCVAILGLGLWKSFSETTTSNASPSFTGASAAPVKVKLLTGSAKFGFLKDPRLVELMSKEGIELELVKSGAISSDVLREKELDAAWPAGANAATDFATSWRSSSTYPVFSTPLAIASWKTLLPVLQGNDLVSKSGTHFDFNLDKALPLMLSGTRWNHLKGNTVFSVNKGFLVNTPDIRMSNTGAMYIASLAYIKNNNEVPRDAELGIRLAEQLSPLITRQGFQEGTLAGPFEDYLGQGMGKAPLVLVYESQFVEAKANGKLRDSHVLLYPQPGQVIKHILVARSPAGQKLGEFLANNPEAQKIAAQYGFRTNNPAVFEDATKKLGLEAPELLNLADAPSTTVLNAMNQALLNKLEGN